MTHKIAALLFALLALLAAGCSGGGAADQTQPSSDPTVSTPVDPPPATPSGDFATAVKFTKLTHRSDGLDNYRKAADLTAPESPAARYIAHQVSMYRAEKTANGWVDEGGEYKFKPHPIAQTIRIKFLGGEGLGKPYS